MPLTGIAAILGLLIHRVIATQERNRPKKVPNACSEAPRAI